MAEDDDLRVTWIAPNIKTMPPLAMMDELGELGKIPNVKLTTCTGDNVTAYDVDTVLRVPADLIIWSGHGTSDGFFLSDGTHSIRAVWLMNRLFTKYLPNARPLVLMASCSSAEKGALLHSTQEIFCRAGFTTIGFPAEASDKAAAVFTLNLVQMMALPGATIMRSYDVAIDSVWDDKNLNRNITIMFGVTEISPPMSMAVDGINERLDRILAFLNGGAAEPVSRGPSDVSSVAGVRPQRKEHTGKIVGIGSRGVNK